MASKTQTVETLIGISDQLTIAWAHAPEDVRLRFADMFDDAHVAVTLLASAISTNGPGGKRSPRKTARKTKAAARTTTGRVETPRTVTTWRTTTITTRATPRRSASSGRR